MAGGDSKPGRDIDWVLQLAALPVLGAAVARLDWRRLNGFESSLLILGGGVVATLALQLVPLPPVVWTGLPGRELLVEGFDAAEITPDWAPLSMSPDATRQAAASLLPAAAVLVAALTLSHRERAALARLVVVVALVSMPVALAQNAGGTESPLRFYELSASSAVGFFVNANHYGAFTYSAIPLAAALMLATPLRRDDARLAALAVGSVTVTLLVLGLAVSQSRAALAIGIAVVLGIGPLVAAARRGSRDRPNGLVGVAAAAGLVLVLQVGMASVLSVLESAPADDARATIFTTTAAVAWNVFPAGTGFGTFVPVYTAHETVETILPNFVNAAHNDWLQIFLEGGVLGLFLAVAWLAWFVIATTWVWRAGTRDAPGLLARAASLTVAALAAHALVDFPLKTGAMMVVFAFACALIAATPIRAAGDEADRTGKKRSRKRSASSLARVDAGERRRGDGQARTGAARRGNGDSSASRGRPEGRT